MSSRRPALDHLTGVREDGSSATHAKRIQGEHSLIERLRLEDLIPDISHLRLVLVGVIAIALTAAIFAGLAIYVSVGLVLESAGVHGPLDERLPRLAAGAIIVLPLLFYLVSVLIQRRNIGRTFYQQATDNRLASAVLMLALVGLVASIGAIIGVVVFMEAEAGLVGAGIAGIVGILALLVARFAGGGLVTSSVKAHELRSPLGPGDGDGATEGVVAGILSPEEQQLTNIAEEIALAAAIPMPRLHIIEDDSINAFAVGHDPSEGRLVVTRGLIERLDREQIQGVIGHEMAHIRNLDSRYGLYVVVLIGLVALITDGFLRIVLAAWRSGAFFKGGEISDDADDAEGATAGFLAGVLFGLLLLSVALLLRAFAPLFSLALQASVSREREFLADATAVELTRNPVALERALEEIRSDTDRVRLANRGTQNLWFDNPVKTGSDRRPGIFSTHPSIQSRIERLRLLRGESAVLAGAAKDDEPTTQS